MRDNSKPKLFQSIREYIEKSEDYEILPYGSEVGGSEEAIGEIKITDNSEVNISSLDGHEDEMEKFYEDLENHYRRIDKTLAVSDIDRDVTAREKYKLVRLADLK